MSRKSRIIKLLHNRDRVHVNEIAEHFGVTPTSIRRDLAQLEANGIIKRTHGHAQLAPQAGVQDYHRRGANFSEEKRRIALAALAMIHGGQSLLFDSGSTTLALANELAGVGHEGVTVITASLPAAIVLASRCQVLMSGGLVQADDMSLIGPEADAYMRSITSDLAFIGSSGVRPGVGLTASSPFLVSIKKQMLAATKRAVALIDSSKFTHDGVHLFTAFADRQIKTVVTVRNEFNARQLDDLADMGVEIVEA